MPAKRITCFIAVCDGCGSEAEGDDHVVHFGCSEAAIEYAVECGWKLHKDKMYCESCTVPVEDAL